MEFGVLLEKYVEIGRLGVDGNDLLPTGDILFPCGTLDSSRFNLISFFLKFQIAV